jgi:hypothetical protein
MRNKAVKAGRICLIIFCTALVFFTVFEAVKLRALVLTVERERSIAGNAASAGTVDLQKMEKELAALREADTGGKAGRGIIPDISETADTVRRLLAQRYIRPERFRITGNGNEAQAEFLFHCNPPRFFSFLAEAVGKGTVEITFVNIRPLTETVLASPEIDVTIRVKGRIPVSENAGIHTVNTIRIAQAFYIPDIPGPSLPDEREVETGEDTEQQENRIAVVGTIRGADDMEYVYGKDIESGRIVAVQNGAARPAFINGGNQNEN